MPFRLLCCAVLLAFFVGCGSEGGGGSRPGGDDGAGGGGGGSDGDGAGGVGGTGGGAGGAGGGGNVEGEGFHLVGIGEDGVAVPIHGHLMLEFRVNRDLLGPGAFRVDLEAPLPAGVWVGTTATSAPGTFEGIELEEAIELGRLYLISGREVEALDEPTTLRLRGSSANWEGTVETEVRIVPWVSNLRDSGDGSLRDLVESLPALRENPTISFAPWLVSPEHGVQTIRLESPIHISEGMRIEAPLGPDDTPLVRLDGQESTRLLQVGTLEEAADGKRAEVHLSGFELVRGKSAGQGGCVENHFDLTLEKSLFEGCVATPTGAGGPSDGIGGGLLSWAGSTLHLEKVRFVENQAVVGGAVASFGTTTIEDAYFENNVAIMEGGALVLVDLEGSLEFELLDSKFIENKASQAGALSIQVRRIQIEEAVFKGNLATGFTGGGALRAYGETGEEEVVIRRSRFEGNRGLGHGGAIHASKLKLLVEDTSFLENASVPPLPDDHERAKGGAIALVSHHGEAEEVLGSLELRRSLLRGNEASWGGGLHVDGQLTMDRCAVIENEASVWGGGIDLVHVPNGTMTNTTVARNRALQGGGIYVHLESEVKFHYLTVIENSATGNAENERGRPGPVGGLAIANATVEMGRSILAKNEATGGTTRDIWVEPDRGSSVANFITRGDNLIGDFKGGSKLLSPEPLINPLLGDVAGDSLTGEEHVLDPGLEELTEVFVGDLPTWIAVPREDGRALDKVASERCTNLIFRSTEDQRGKARPSGTGCDVGAAER